MRFISRSRVIWAVVIACIGIGTFPVLADLLIFFNGDFYYGKGTVLQPSGDVIIEVRGVARRFKKSQIRQFIPGIDAPAPGQIVSVTDFKHIASLDIPSITAEITNPYGPIKVGKDKEMMLDVEKGFEIPALRLWPSAYSFYRRNGCFMAGILVNNTTETYSGLQFRAHLYDENARILSSKDFTVFRFPGIAPDGTPGQRKFEIDFPDVSYALVHRMRILRKF